MFYKVDLEGHMISLSDSISSSVSVLIILLSVLRQKYCRAHFSCPLSPVPEMLTLVIAEKCGVVSCANKWHLVCSDGHSGEGE